MSFPIEVRFTVYHSGHWVINENEDVAYMGGGVLSFECEHEELFTKLRNKLGDVMYWKKVSYTYPYEDSKDRRQLFEKDNSFKMMCDGGRCVRVLNVFLEESTENDDEEIDGEPCEEELRVERNVAPFAEEDEDEEEFDYHNTPPNSDDEGEEETLVRCRTLDLVELNIVLDDERTKLFHKFYVCFANLRTQWSTWCRPIFGLDGCFLKSTLKGQLLAAVGRYANNGMYPFCAVVDVENEDNWTWFIQKLNGDCVNLQDGQGLLNAIERKLPKVEYRMCARHIYGNLKKLSPCQNDMKESFNNAIDPTKYLPMVEMLETMRRRTMQCIEMRMKKAETYKGRFTKRAAEFIALEQEKLKFTKYVSGLENGRCEVLDCGKYVSLHMGMKTCACRKWEMTGLPCRHALRIINNKRLNHEDYTSE
ncbi:Zinc finger SWIM-type [Arabidopsis thaliana x Arabidopsis arenosa]|uniref:SWIM-type domain-containing protein n=2 Tax=Arabidopsis TaxID=3701 RepID=A0A178VTR2_ARATH|nr:Zinc finger SWIM-type [Arabidopsis thaliana x Arabidopsis arenosa]OAP08771.1 hypothetical protein AXX17_AT2G09710 [Arabidopsis thaliana]